jgi:circadian clock protein KaiC
MTDLKKLNTGVPGLDQILGGGLFEKGIYILGGLTGVGKTILGNQIAFHVATKKKTLVVTLLSESLGKLLAHLRTLEFFDEKLMVNHISYVSGFSELKEGGITGFQSWLFDIIKKEQIKFMVLDGFKSINRYAKNDNEFADFVFQLNSYASMAGCTILILSTNQKARATIEDNLVDGIVQLESEVCESREHREITIYKWRGGSYLAGKHPFKITYEGIRIFPRIESLAKSVRNLPHIPEKLPFNLSELDKMTLGGVTAGSVTSILGSAGSGKTLLALKFLEAGLAKGESGYYFGFYESPENLVIKAARVGIELRQYIESGLLIIKWYPPVDQNIYQLAHEILNDIDSYRTKRLVIDGVDGFVSSAILPDRIQNFFIGLAILLREKSVTTLITEESSLYSKELVKTKANLSATVENIFFLRYVEVKNKVHRFISIFKLRDSGYDSTIAELDIKPEGISIYKNAFSEEGDPLTGSTAESTLKGSS